MYFYLTYDQEKFIKDQVESGRYENANDVIHAALAALMAEDENRDAVNGPSNVVPFERDRDVEFFRSL